MIDPAIRSQAARPNRGSILMPLRFALRCVPVGAFLPSAAGTWQAWIGPLALRGPPTVMTLPTGWAMDKYYGLMAMLVVVLGIAGVFVWVYLPPR
jgi:hypothetical protein